MAVGCVLGKACFTREGEAAEDRNSHTSYLHQGRGAWEYYLASNNPMGADITF